MKVLIILLALVALISCFAIFLPAQNALEDVFETIGSNVDLDDCSDETDSPYSLSGYWILKNSSSVLDLSTFPGEEQVLFTRRGSAYEGLEYSSMYVEHGTRDVLYYVCEGISSVAYCDGTYYSTAITFVGTQVVSQEFYEWFTEMYYQPEWVKETETDATTETDSSEESGYSLSGTWKFNDTVNLRSFPGKTKVSFIANGETFSSMYVWSSSDGSKALLYGSSVSVDVYMYSWYEEYQEITFEGTQSVSEEFYEWFTSNATQN